jgi:hypothetical protein
MSGSLWRYVIVLIVLVHGIGHVLFLSPFLGITQWGQTTHSWLLTTAVGPAATRVTGALLWLLVVIGFSAAGIGLVGQFAWWRSLAVVSAGVSVLSLILFAGGSSAQPILSAAAMDVVILVALLWARWPSADLVGV